MVTTDTTMMEIRRRLPVLAALLVVFCVDRSGWSQELTLEDASSRLRDTTSSIDAAKILTDVLKRFDNRTLIAHPNQTFAISAAWRAHIRPDRRPTTPRFGYVPLNYKPRGVERFVQLLETRLKHKVPDWWISLLSNVDSEVRENQIEWKTKDDLRSDNEGSQLLRTSHFGEARMSNETATWLTEEKQYSTPWQFEFDEPSRIGLFRSENTSVLMSGLDFHGRCRIVDVDQPTLTERWRSTLWGTGDFTEALAGAPLTHDVFVDIIVQPEFVTFFGAVTRRPTLDPVKQTDRASRMDAAYFIEQFFRRDGVPSFRFASNLWQIY